MITFKNPRSHAFDFGNERNILLEKDMGIKNDLITTGIRYSTLFSIEGLFAPPYVSSDFIFNMRVYGEKVKTDRFTWYPFAIERFGNVNGLEVQSLVFAAGKRRSIIIKATLINPTADDMIVPLQVDYHGGVDYLHLWEFTYAKGSLRTDMDVSENRLYKKNNDKALDLIASIPMSWFELASLWESKVSVPANGEKTIWFTISLGNSEETKPNTEYIMSNPERAQSEAISWYESEVDSIFNVFPDFDSDNIHLKNYYYRSLAHYILNKWRVPEFVLNPYYSTGGLQGGCVGSYLWDVSAGFETHALYDPSADKNIIKQYLKLDITRCFAFSPIDGRAFGPWYMINQEKIIMMIYHYVKLTGDIDFLFEEVNGKKIYEWASYQALIRDDVNKPITLTDYGIDGENHLELRRGIPYRGILPDLNGRRYQSYMWAYEITKWAGHPDEILPKRAAELKPLLKKELWNEETRWFDFISHGKRDIRYTIQMFKLFSSDVLDEEMEEGLLSHLNETEFLSDYGFHSMSKLDIAYDQVDIDNGGSGACSIFPNLIAEKLYKAGRAEYADDIMRRVLWWGERLPYWGDSLVANYIDYRQDTPLQNTIGAVTGAQCILFGMFGVDANPDGTVTFNPHLPSFCNEISFNGLKLFGKLYSGKLTRDGFELTSKEV